MIKQVYIWVDNDDLPSHCINIEVPLGADKMPGYINVIDTIFEYAKVFL